jgi:aminoglycoside phosphotransferase (APT) family kinase protein
VAHRLLIDPAIPTLPTVLDPLELAAHLREALPSLARSLEAMRIRLLRHHAGKRCVVEVTWRTGEASLALIGKVYAKDRSDVYRLMVEIRRAGCGPRAEFSIPEPTAYLESLQLLLQEKVEGRPATDSFLSDDESERSGAAERCAGWLARFHALAPRVGPRVPGTSQLRALEEWSRRVASQGEPLAQKARELWERLEAAAPALSGIDVRTIHGDYTHHQVILARRRTVTVDWDKYRLADPSEDVARFVVGLQRLALRARGSLRALDGAADVFLRTYLTSHRQAVGMRLAFQRAAVCLEHAKHDVHKQADGWRDRAVATLDEGLRVLAQGV